MELLNIGNNMVASVLGAGQTAKAMMNLKTVIAPVALHRIGGRAANIQARGTLPP
jgi:hypothetical protein